MADETRAPDAAPQGGTTGADEKRRAVNDQIADAIAQVNAMVSGSSQAHARAMADQVMAQAIGLAMQNAVAQQQQTYILRNAVTTAAARAILDSSPEQAMQFAREVLSSDDVAQTLERLKNLMDDVNPPRKTNASGAQASKTQKK